MIAFSLANTPYEKALAELQNLIVTSRNETYIIDFSSDYANSKIIRDFVGALFDAFEINHPWRGRFILITDELINNSIEHGSNAGDTNRCIITAGKRDEENHFYISLEVHDNGKNGKTTAENMEKAKREKGEEDVVYMGKRGRGLFHITEKIVDKLSFSQSEK